MAHLRIEDKIVMDKDYAQKHIFWTGVEGDEDAKELFPRLHQEGVYAGFYVVTIPEGKQCGTYARRSIKSIDFHQFVGRSYWHGEKPQMEKIELAFAERVE